MTVRSEACPEPCQTSEMERFSGKVSIKKPLAILAKPFILGV